MMAGSSKKISCMGIIGDGCGGGREFIVEDTTLYSYDPYTKEKMILLEAIEGATAISKHRCTLTIECVTKTIQFDLSALQIIN